MKLQFRICEAIDNYKFELDWANDTQFDYNQSESVRRYAKLIADRSIICIDMLESGATVTEASIFFKTGE